MLTKITSEWIPNASQYRNLVLLTKSVIHFLLWAQDVLIKKCIKQVHSTSSNSTFWSFFSSFFWLIAIKVDQSRLCFHFFYYILKVDQNELCQSIITLTSTGRGYQVNFMQKMSLFGNLNCCSHQRDTRSSTIKYA